MVPENLACIEPLRLHPSQPAHKLSLIPLVPFNRIWANKAFEIQTLGGAGQDVAAFGNTTHRSISLGEVSVRPVSMWCNVNKDSKVT